MRVDIKGLKTTVDAIAKDQALGVERQVAMQRGRSQFPGRPHERLDVAAGYGRGERTRANTPSPILLIPVTNVPSYVHRSSGIA
jgi:hypothetical protein